jgi:membrane-associated phospholipid phosphatase
VPFVVLLIVATAAGVIGTWAAWHYPSPLVDQMPAESAAEALEEQAWKRPWLRRRLRRRLDPETATGLALTLALGAVILGGLVVGLLALLVRSSHALVRVDTGAGQWGVDNATATSTRLLQLLTNLGATWFVLCLAGVLTLVEARRVPSRWTPVFLVTVIGGEVIIVNTIKTLLDRVRPTFNPIAETLGPSFPSGHTASAAASYAAFALVLARRRSPRTRSLLAGAAVGIPVLVAGTRVLLGVHWLSDTVAGLAFGWAWFAVCAIAFGGRLLQFGVVAEKATAAEPPGDREPLGTYRS